MACEMDDDCAKEHTKCVKGICGCADTYYVSNNECIPGSLDFYHCAFYMLYVFNCNVQRREKLIGNCLKVSILPALQMANAVRKTQNA